MLCDDGNTSFRDIPACTVDSNELMTRMSGSRPDSKPVSEDLPCFFRRDRLFFDCEDAESRRVQHFLDDARVFTIAKEQTQCDHLF